jgi:flagellin
MPISLLTNGAALSALRQLQNNDDAANASLERLASGNRINKASDDASGLARSAALETEIRSGRQADSNVQDAKSMVQVSEGALNEINNDLIRLRELAIQAASDTLDDSERAMVNDEAASIRADIDRIAQSTHYQGNSLLDGSGKVLSFQVGPENTENDRISYDTAKIDARAETLGLGDVDLSTNDSALDSLTAIDAAIKNIQSPREKTAAFADTLDSISRQLEIKNDALSDNLSRLRDTDYAKEASEAFLKLAQRNAALAVLVQANSQPSEVLRLLTPPGNFYRY